MEEEERKRREEKRRNEGGAVWSERVHRITGEHTFLRMFSKRPYVKMSWLQTKENTKA